MSDGTGNETYAYDDNGFETSTVTTYSGLPAQTITYAYYPDSSRQSMTTPVGTFSSSYDGAGRMTGLTNPYSEAFSWTHASNGWLTGQQSANAAITAYAYNARGQMTNLTNLMNDNSTLLSQFNSVSYDAVNNRTAITASIPAAPTYGGTTNYAYDVKNQVTQEQSTQLGGFTNNFGYDAAGNATTFRGSARTYNVNNQDTSDSYDGNGNPTVYHGNGLTFDPENRLSSYGATMTAGYRGDNLRAWKQTAAGVTYFLYDGIQPICEINATGTVTAVNTSGANGILARRSGGSSVFYTFDMQGNTVQRLSSNGAILSTHAFNAFGSRSTTVANADPFGGFKAQHGYYTDYETGLQLLTYRYYDSSTGRFVNRDPIQYEGGVNLYNHVQNNSPNMEDPVGLFNAGKFKKCFAKFNLWALLLGCLTGNIFCKALLALLAAGIIACLVLNGPDGETLGGPCILALLKAYRATCWNLAQCLMGLVGSIIFHAVLCAREAMEPGDVKKCTIKILPPGRPFPDPKTFL